MGRKKKGKARARPAETRADATGDLIRIDGWQNVLTGLGIETKDARLQTGFKAQPKLDVTTLEALYREDALFARVIDVVPDHCVRKWIRVTGTVDEDGQVDDDFGAQVLDALDELDARERFREAMKLDRLFGGSAILIGADDGQAPDQPLNLDTIRTVSHLTVLDRFEIWPSTINRDPTSSNFRRPETYQLLVEQTEAAEPITEIHHSRVIAFRGIMASERLSAARGHWGEPLSQRIYTPIRAVGSLLESMETMVQDTNQGVAKIKGLSKMFASDQGNQTAIRRLMTMNLVRSALNMIVLDESEEYERRSIAFSGLRELALTFFEWLSAVSEIPLTILFGMAPGGLSTDDESGRKAFYASIAAKQRSQMSRPIDRIIEALLYAQDGPTGGRVPAQWSKEFLDLQEQDEMEVATRRKMEAETDAILLANMVIGEDEARSRWANDPTSPYVLNLSDEGDDRAEPDDE